MERQYIIIWELGTDIRFIKFLLPVIELKLYYWQSEGYRNWKRRNGQLLRDGKQLENETQRVRNESKMSLPEGIKSWPWVKILISKDLEIYKNELIKYVD